MSIHPRLLEAWRIGEYDADLPAPRPLFHQKQRGGGERTLHVAGHPITILETADRTGFLIVGGRVTTPHPCFRLSINTRTRHAHLEELLVPQDTSSRSPCFGPISEADRFINSSYAGSFNDETNNSALVVLAAYQCAQEHGARTMEYTDNSSKTCNIHDKNTLKLRLPDFYTLLTGRTWYESILLGAGATAVTPFLDRSDVDLAEDRRRAATVSWETMRGNILSPVPLPPSLDTTAAGSGRQVLQFLRGKKNPDICNFLARHLGDFLRQSGMISIHGIRWMCSIPAITTTDRRHTVRRTRGLRRRMTYRR